MDKLRRMMRRRAASYVCGLEHPSGEAFVCSGVSAMRDHLWLVHHTSMDSAAVATEDHAAPTRRSRRIRDAR